MQNRINWAHAQKKGLMGKIAQLVQAHDAATPSQQIHLRIELATFVQRNYLHLNGAPCVFCSGNREYMNEAREEIGQPQEVREEQPTEEEQLEELPLPVDDTQRKRSKTKSKNITETD